MKKSMFLVAIAATALASCSSDDVMQLNNGNEINFSVVSDNASRAATVYCNNNLMTGFNLYAGYNNGGWSTFIEEDLVTVSDGGKCTQSETRYWPETGELTFWGLVNTPADNFKAMIPASNYTADVVWGVETPVVKDFTPALDVTKQTDLLYAVAAGCTKSAAPVQMNFRHALSQIEFRAKNLNPQLHVVIEAVRVGQTDAQGTYTLPSESTSNNFVDHQTDKTTLADEYVKGTWSDVKGKADYQVQFGKVAVPYAEGKVQDLTISNDGTETYNNSLILIPTMEDGEATTAWNPASPTYDGTYLAVYCTIYNVAGDSYVEDTDVAVLHKGWAVIPVSFKWKQGKKYIYTFNFSKEGNGGYEGGDDLEDKEPSDEPVLTGIELEVTVDDFIRGEEPEQEMDTDNKLTNENIATKLAQGGSFVLAEDITVNTVFDITKNTIIDLDGKTLKYTGDNRLFKVTGATLTLENGDVVVESANLNVSTTAAYLGTAYEGGKIVVNSGNYETNGCTVFHTSGGDLEVNGGTFAATETGYTPQGKYGYKYTLNAQNNDLTSIVVKGGKFYNWNPAASAGESPVANFVAEGYAAVESETGVWTVYLAPAADANGNVTAVADGVIAQSIVVPAAGSFDGQGYTLTVADAIASNAIIHGKGAATIQNVTIEGNNVKAPGGKSTRALYFTGEAGDINIANVVVKGVGYALNVNTKNKKENSLTVSNSTLQGWTSFSGFASATFTNVVFECGNYFTDGNINGMFRPYSAATLDGCTFEKGFTLSSVSAGITLKNCKVGDTVITADNIASLLSIDGEASAISFE